MLKPKKTDSAEILALKFAIMDGDTTAIQSVVGCGLLSAILAFGAVQSAVFATESNLPVIYGLSVGAGTIAFFFARCGAKIITENRQRKKFLTELVLRCEQTKTKQL